VEQAGRDLPSMLMIEEAYLRRKDPGKVKTTSAKDWMMLSVCHWIEWSYRWSRWFRHWWQQSDLLTYVLMNVPHLWYLQDGWK
jgi:hypothetical protein